MMGQYEIGGKVTVKLKEGSIYIYNGIILKIYTSSLKNNIQNSFPQTRLFIKVLETPNSRIRRFRPWKRYGVEDRSGICLIKGDRILNYTPPTLIKEYSISSHQHDVFVVTKSGTNFLSTPYISTYSKLSQPQNYKISYYTEEKGYEYAVVHYNEVRGISNIYFNRLMDSDVLTRQAYNRFEINRLSENLTRSYLNEKGI